MNSSRPAATRFATRANDRLAYDPGATGDDRRPVVVLLHDLLDDRASLRDPRTAMTDGYRVVSPDARGHGASATLANRWYTIGELADDLLAVLDAEGIATAHLIGRGLGGATAFDMARRQPERVASLVLIAPALRSVLDDDADLAVRSARHDARGRDRAAADAAYKGLTDQALDAYLTPRRGAGWRDRLTKPQLAAIRRQAGALAALLPALDAYEVERAAARAMTTPALVLAPAEAGVDRWTGERLSALLPNARLATFAPGDAADESTRLVRAFIDEWERLSVGRSTGDDALAEASG